MRRLSLYRAAAWVLLCGVLAAEAQAPRGLDFLNDKLPIPDSDRFDEPSYTQSGVGLAFGIDQRLSYFSGNYAEAADRFQASVKKFKFKAEIWVFLARAQFYQDNPEEARQTLQEAAVIMPDLQDRLWQPLVDGLNWEIRQRANQLQLQIDFYAPGQSTFFSLFRYYTFLGAFDAASGVIHAAESRSNKMNELAEMASAASFSRHRQQAEKWQGLADQLGAEMLSLGQQVTAPKGNSVKISPSATPKEDRDLLEETRRLQLLVDYYQGKPQDFQKLFDNYQLLAWPDHAANIIKALEREVSRTKLRAEEAQEAQEEINLLEKAEEFEQLRKDLQETLKLNQPSTDSAGEGP
jgi:hypothetical protein